MSSNFGKIVLIIIASLIILAFRFFQTFNQPQPLVGTQVEITSRVGQEPVIIGQSQYFSFDQYKIRTRIFPKYHYGDQLEIVGTPNKDLLISFPEIKKIGEGEGIFKQIFTLRRFLLSLASKIWPEPESSLFTGLVLGHDRISTDFRNILINTGTIHIVVVSGQNVAMLAGFISVASAFLKRRLVAVLTISVIIFYTILTGAQPPTVRAAVMGGLAFLARMTGREDWGFWSLATTVIVMLLFDPKLAINVSFQLSFAATFGILFASEPIKALLKNFPKIAKESLAITLSAWIFTAPIIALYFSQFTPVTPISNLLVVPVVPFLMIGGVISLLAGSVNLVLGEIVGLVPFVGAAYFTFVIQNLSRLPFSTLKIFQPNVALVASFYLFLIAAIIWSQKLLAKT